MASAALRARLWMARESAAWRLAGALAFLASDGGPSSSLRRRPSLGVPLASLVPLAPKIGRARDSRCEKIWGVLMTLCAATSHER